MSTLHEDRSGLVEGYSCHDAPAIDHESNKKAILAPHELNDKSL